MSKAFISHSSQDDAFVRQLQQALGHLGQDVWIDSRELRGVDPLWSEIQQGIEKAAAHRCASHTTAQGRTPVGAGHAREKKRVG